MSNFRYRLLVAASARALMGHESMEPFFARAVRAQRRDAGHPEQAICRVWEDVTAECAELRNQN